MQTLTNLLTIIYGIIMITAAIASFQKIPFWLICINVITNALLILACLGGHNKIVAVCLFAVLLIAIINGYFLNGKVNWSHWFIRLTITIALSGLNWFF